MKHELRASIKVNEDGTSYKVSGGDIKKFLSLHPGERFSLKIQKDKTDPQTGYYWVLCKILGDEIGMDKDETHEILKYKFLQEEVVNEKTGECFTRIKSTNELSKEEMGYYIDQIIRWAAEELFIVLPEAGEKLKLDFDESN